MTLVVKRRSQKYLCGVSDEVKEMLLIYSIMIFYWSYCILNSDIRLKS